MAREIEKRGMIRQLQTRAKVETRQNASVRKERETENQIPSLRKKGILILSESPLIQRVDNAIQLISNYKPN